jgi:hypothetical protein
MSRRYPQELKHEPQAGVSCLGRPSDRSGPSWEPFAVDSCDRAWTAVESKARRFGLCGLPGTPVDTVWRSTDQEVGGSSPSGRAERNPCVSRFPCGSQGSARRQWVTPLARVEGDWSSGGRDSGRGARGGVCDEAPTCLTDQPPKGTIDIEPPAQRPLQGFSRS